MKNHKKIVLISLLLLTIVLSACQPKVNITTLTELEQSFQDTLDAVVEDNDKVLNAVIMVQGQNFCVERRCRLGRSPKPAWR